MPVSGNRVMRGTASARGAPSTQLTEEDRKNLKDRHELREGGSLDTKDRKDLISQLKDKNLLDRNKTEFTDQEIFAAVRNFQQQNSLRVDGIVGDQTWAKLLLNKDCMPGFRMVQRVRQPEAAPAGSSASVSNADGSTVVAPSAAPAPGAAVANPSFAQDAKVQSQKPDSAAPASATPTPTIAAASASNEPGKGSLSGDVLAAGAGLAAMALMYKIPSWAGRIGSKVSTFAAKAGKSGIGQKASQLAERTGIQPVVTLVSNLAKRVGQSTAGKVAGKVISTVSKVGPALKSVLKRVPYLGALVTACEIPSVVNSSEPTWKKAAKVGAVGIAIAGCLPFVGVGAGLLLIGVSQAVNIAVDHSDSIKKGLVGST